MEDRTIELMTKYLDGDYKVSPMASFKSTLQDIKDIIKELDINFPKATVIIDTFRLYTSIFIYHKYYSYEVKGRK